MNLTEIWMNMTEIVYFDQKWSDLFNFLQKQPLFVTFITLFANFSHFKPPKTIKDWIFKILFMKK